MTSGLAGGGQTVAFFDDGHCRQLPRLARGPFRYKTYAYDNFRKSAPFADGKARKTAVVSPSMMYLLYPLKEEVEGYPKEQFLDDLVNECEKDIRGCFEAGARLVSIDFTEGRKSHPLVGLLFHISTDLIVSPSQALQPRMTLGIHGRTRTSFKPSSTSTTVSCHASVQRNARISASTLVLAATATVHIPLKCLTILSSLHCSKSTQATSSYSSALKRTRSLCTSKSGSISGKTPMV